MVKCDNCEADAAYLIEDRGAAPQNFCSVHLPWFYKKRAAAGTLKAANQPAPVEGPVKKSAPKKKAPTDA